MKCLYKHGYSMWKNYRKKICSAWERAIRDFRREKKYLSLKMNKVY